MSNYLDKYINKENLSKEDMEHLFSYPIKVFAYGIGIKENIDYKYVYGLLVYVQKMVGRNYKEDVFYIINKTDLSKWHKFKLKFSYCFL